MLCIPPLTALRSLATSCTGFGLAQRGVLQSGAATTAGTGSTRSTAATNHRAMGAHRRGTVTRHCSDSTSARSEEHTSELQSHSDLVCRLLLEKKKKRKKKVIKYLSIEHTSITNRSDCKLTHID